MVQYQECDLCHNYDITGFMPCADHGHHQLCPKCTAAILGVSEEEIRELLMSEFCSLRAARLTQVAMTLLPQVGVAVNDDSIHGFAAGYMYRVTAERQALDNLDTQEEDNGRD